MTHYLFFNFNGIAVCSLHIMNTAGFGLLSVSGVLFFAPYLALLKQYRLANAFAVVVGFLTLHQGTLHRQQKRQIELSNNFWQGGCSQSWRGATTCSPSPKTSTTACLTWLWDSWVTYFGKSNWMLSFSLSSPNLSSTICWAIQCSCLILQNAWVWVPCLQQDSLLKTASGG